MDSSANIYVGGRTYSPDFPVNVGDVTLGGYNDAFVVKINSAGSAIVWATFLGGSSYENLTSLAVDSSGNVYCTGTTDSVDFPTTVGAFDTTYSNGDSFVTKINSTGTALVYSTFLGGTDGDYAARIAVDSSGNAYVAGYTYSTDFPVSGGFDITFNGSSDGFIVKLNPTGTALVWSSFLGGSSSDYITGLAVDAAGNVYLGGYTYSSDFPVVAAYDPSFNGGSDCFITKVNAAGTTIAWSTFFGGAGYEYVESLAIDGSGNVYITGETSLASPGPQYPVTGSAYQISLSGSYSNGFVTKFSSAGGLVWSSYFGGNSSTYCTGIALDGTSPVITGYTYSTNLAFTTAGAYDRIQNGSADVFVAKFNPGGGSLVYSTWVGGSDYETAQGLAVDGSGNAYVTGYTYSTNFPTVGGFKPTISGSIDAFVFRLNTTGTTLAGSSYLGGANGIGNDEGRDVAVDATGNIYVVGWTLSSNFPVVNALDPTYNFNGSFSTSDVFVTKYNPAGTAMLWSTYLGGTDDEEAQAIALDASGNAYVTGYTYSTNFPVQNAYQAGSNGGAEVFVTKINTSGTLAYSTYLGGLDYEYAYGIAVDSAGSAYVTGYTYSTNFPIVSAYQPVKNGISTYDMFVSKLNPTGNGLVYSTYLGGSNDEYGFAIKVDSAFNAYVGGFAYSTDFLPLLTPTYAPHAPSVDLVVVRLNSAGTPTAFTYLGGTDYEYLYDLAIDGSSNVYVTGYTYSTDFPTTVGAYSTVPLGSSEGFVTKLNAGTLTRAWSTYLGGTNSDYPARLRVDASGNVYVTGTTYSFDFPVKNAFDATFNGSADVFITKINAGGATLAWSSFLGGSNYENATGLALGPNGTVIVAGLTQSADFPLGGGLDSVLNGEEAFVTRIDNSDPFPPAISGQFRQGSGASLAVGAYTNEANILIKATIGDPDEDQVQLSIEIKPIDVSFDGLGTINSALMAPGSLATVIVPLPVGTPQYHWRCRTIDAFSRASSWVAFGSNSDTPPTAARDVGKDTANPVVTITSPSVTPTTTATSPISISGTAADDLAGVTALSWTKNSVPQGSIVVGSTWTIGSVALSAGINDIVVTATDGAGNVGNSATMRVIYDTLPPATLAITAPTAGPTFLTGASSVVVSGSATDNFGISTVTWTTDRGAIGTATLVGPPTSVTWSTTVALSPGLNNLTVTATDGGGLTRTAALAITFDNVPPAITITNPLSGSTFNSLVSSSVTINGNASDASGIPGAGVTWSVSATGFPTVNGTATPSGPPTAITWSALVPLNPGANLVTVTAADVVGNLNLASITLFLDTAAPVVTITIPTASPTYTTGSGTVTLGGSSSDDLTVASVLVNGVPATLTGPPNSPSWSLAGVGLSIGANVITVTATDGVGRTGTDQITITYDNTAPAVLITTPPTANHVTSTSPITVIGAATDQAPGVVSAITVVNSTTGASSVVTTTGIGTSNATLSAPVNLVIGTNSVVVTATDDGLNSTSVTLTITLDPTAPAVTITGPTGSDTYVSGTGTLPLSGVASDNRGVTQVAWSLTALGFPPSNGVATLSGPPTSCTWSVSPAIPLHLGLNHITVTASDQAGNSTQDTLDVTYDTTVPDITITTPTSATTFITTTTPILISGNASDVGSTVKVVTWSKNSSSGPASGTATGTTSWSAGAVALDPGANVFTVIATDDAGNTRSDAITIFLDTQLPTVLITSPTANPTMSTTSATVTLGGLAGDDILVTAVNWQSVGATTKSGTATGTTFWSVASIPLDPGNNVITVRSVDGAGQLSNPKTLTISYDPTGPIVTIAVPSTNPFSTTTTPVSMSGTASDNIAVTEVFWVNASTGGIGSASGTTNWSALCPLTSGSNVILVTAKDAAGNFTTASTTVIYDPAAPLVTITGPTTGISFTTGTTPITISGVTSDDIGVTSVAWTTDAAVVPSSGFATGSLLPDWSASIPLAPGSNLLTFTATDGVGRTGITRITVIYDPVLPQVTISAPSAQPTYLSTISPIALGGVASDNLNLQIVKWVNSTTGTNGTAQGLGAWSVPSVPLQTGPNVITVTATDGVNNNGSATITVIYDGVAPAVAITTLGPDPFTDPYSTTTRPLPISGTASDNLNLASVTWTNSLGGGGTATLTPVVAPTSYTWNASAYLLPGANLITVTAQDAHGQSTSTTVTINFTPEIAPPTISIELPSNTGSATSLTQLSAVSGYADDNVGVVAVTWRNQTTGVRGSATLSAPGPLGVPWAASIPLTNGTNVIVATAVDDAGNTTTATISIDFDSGADVSTPSISFTGPVPLLDPWTSSPILVTLDVTDDIGVASVTWTNSGTGGNGIATFVSGTTWTASVALALGTNRLTFTAFDAAGNTATDVLTVNFFPTPGDTSNPVVTIVNPPTGVPLNVTVAALTLSGTASDNVAVAEVIWSNVATGETGSADGTNTWTGTLILTPGTNVITVRVFDTSGNTDTDQLTVVYSPPAPVIPAGHCGLLGLEGFLLLALCRRLARRKTI